MSSVVPEGWGKIDLEEGISALVSGQSPNRKENCATGDAFGILKTTAIHWGRFDEKQNQEVLDDYEPNMKHLVLENDILITKAGPAHRVGVVAQARNLRSNVLLSGKMTALRVNDKFSSDFLTYALCQEEAQNHLKANTTGMASSQTNFTHDALLRVPILSPPLPEQKKIASILTSVDEVIENTQKQIDKLQDLKKATMNELLTKGIGHTEFKDSELGRIPKSWSISNIEKLTQFVTSGSRGWSQYYSSEGSLFIRIGNLTRDHINLKFADIQLVEPPSGGEGTRTKVKVGDILVSITADLGVIGVVNESLGEAYVNQHVCLVRLESVSDVNARWVGHFLSGHAGQEQFAKKNDGGAKAGLNLPTIRSIIVPIPSPEEQNKVVRVLDRLDSKISIKQTKLAKHQSLKKSLMQDLLTGKVRVMVN